MVDIPAFIPLADFNEHSSHILGSVASELKWYLQHKIQIPAAVVVPVATLNQIEPKHLPLPLAKQLMKVYEQEFDAGFVKLTSSVQGGKTIENIQGDSNLIESLEELWHHSPHHPILVQAQPQAEVAGLVYTCHPLTEKKSVMIVQATWGVLPPKPNRQTQFDTWEVDVKTGNILNRDIAVKTHQLKRELENLEKHAVPATRKNQAALSDTQIRTLAKYVYELKRSLPHHVCVQWCLEDKHIFVLSTREFYPEAAQEFKSSPLSKHVPLLTGTAIQPGSINGEVGLITKPKDWLSFKTGQIAVVADLDPDDQAYLKKASGLICEKPIRSPILMAAIKRLGIPTLAPAPRALHFLSKQERIFLHTSSSRHGIVTKYG